MSTLRVDSIRGQTADGTNRYVVQVVSTTLTTATTFSSGDWTDLSGLSVTITPSSSNNKILIMANINASYDDAGMLRVLRDSTVVGSGTEGNDADKRGFAMVRQGATNEVDTYSITHLDSPATTSAVTYKIQGNRDGGSGTAYINRRNSNADYSTSSHITLMEIAQ